MAMNTKIQLKERKNSFDMEAPISPGIGLENVSSKRFRNSISPTRQGISLSKRLELKSMSALRATFNGLGS